MNIRIFASAIAIAVSTQVACAQFGSGIVFDPHSRGMPFNRSLSHDSCIPPPSRRPEM